VLQPSRPPRPVTGIALSFRFSMQNFMRISYCAVSLLLKCVWLKPGTSHGDLYPRFCAHLDRSSPNVHRGETEAVQNSTVHTCPVSVMVIGVREHSRTLHFLTRATIRVLNYISVTINPDVGQSRYKYTYEQSCQQSSTYFQEANGDMSHLSFYGF
jgi:hypothetical protein